MAIKREAYVARTAHDLKHVNHLGVPQYGTIELRVRLTEDKGSKSYLPDAATPGRPPTGKGSDEFHFAPGPQLDPGTWAIDPAKTDEVELWYHLFNPHRAIESARLELYRRFDKTPFWTRELKGEELEDGEHVLTFGAKAKWDGKLDPPHADFPSGFVGVERAPYKLKLSVKGSGICNAQEVWTYFQVLIAKLELEYGPQETLPATVAGKADHRKTLAELLTQGAKPPAPGAKAKVFLLSNIFKKGHSMFDDSLFTEYEKMWDKGALVPLFARVAVRDSADNAVFAPKALGQVKFLWDWESKLAAQAVTFVDQAQDYDQNATTPKGQNCHFDRGGKRGPLVAQVLSAAPKKTEPVFPSQAGYAPAATLTDGAFPFKVDVVASGRVWSTFSTAWDEGLLASKTGVLFQPARQAGDAYTVTVYVAHDVSKTGTVALNVTDDAPLKVQPALTVATGTFEVWRRIQFIGYKKKVAAISDLTVATVQGIYEKAFVELKDDSGGSAAIVAGTWNAAFTTGVGTLSLRNQDMVDTAVNQHAAGNHGCDFRTLAAWKAAIVARTGATLAAVNASLTAAGIRTAADYATHCNNVGPGILESVFNGQLAAADGANIFHVDGLHNLTAAASSVLRGYALDLPAGTDRRCGYLQLGKPSDYSGPPNDLRELTGAHEFGHHFFLPHTPQAGEAQDYKAHDKAVLDCLMSYNFSVPRKLCGFCHLRLRGWSKAKLDPDGTKNKKP
ncbi:MAG TPA: hypothetical protein VGP07_20460 [Polyangia bacterium]|jgi:hypothetical protein